MSSEHITPGPEEEFISDHRPKDDLEVEIYYHLKIADIKAGKTTWMVRDFDQGNGNGYAYGLWVNHREVCLIDDNEDGNFSVYKILENSEEMFITGTEKLWEAIVIAISLVDS
jgi:hypothetical protein